jgi:hypothetical protein
MKFHEKSLELNITHELLNLADSWYWFLLNIPLWKYWKPGYQLPFQNSPKSLAYGLHINVEGKDDKTGNNGGGYDVKIKSGKRGHLLFIQYKKGNFEQNGPGGESIFTKYAPHEHFIFKINTPKTNQHFKLRNLAQGIGTTNGNCVVYALPLIRDIEEMEKNAGKLIRKTKFISIHDLDTQAKKNNICFTAGKHHNFRIDPTNMDRCEVNYYYYYYSEPDRSPEIISDMIAVKFEEHLRNYINQIESNLSQNDIRSIAERLQQAYIEYFRYLLHLFEVNPLTFEDLHPLKIAFYNNDEFKDYESLKHDKDIISKISSVLEQYYAFFQDLKTTDSISLFNMEIPHHEANILLPNKDGLTVSLKSEDHKFKKTLEKIICLSI